MNQTPLTSKRRAPRVPICARGAARPPRPTESESAPSECDDNVSSAIARSCMEWNRDAAFFSRQRSTMRVSAGKAGGTLTMRAGSRFAVNPAMTTDYRESPTAIDRQLDMFVQPGAAHGEPERYILRRQWNQPSPIHFLERAAASYCGDLRWLIFQRFKRIDTTNGFLAIKIGSLSRTWKLRSSSPT